MSKLKTVWDAVNELRGEWIFECKESWEEKTNHIITFESKLTPSECSFHDNFMVINYTEFNELVEEMTLGLDVNPVNHGHYLNYVYADKSPLEKDSIVNKPLVYTQEMADNGVMPSVGMEVLLEEDTEFFSCASGEISTLKANDIVYVVAIGNRSDNNATVITLMKQGAGFCTINPDYIKPIDQRTKKEKAIDAIDKIITDAYQDLTDDYKSNSRFKHEAINLLDEIIDGTVDGVKWVGE